MTAGLLVGLYFFLRFTFGLFTPYNSWTAKRDIEAGIIQLIELGELPLHREQRDRIAEDNGFEFSYHGCMVSSDISNGAKYYNRTVIKYLNKKNGPDWWQTIEHKLDSLDTWD